MRGETSAAATAGAGLSDPTATSLAGALRTRDARSAMSYVGAARSSRPYIRRSVISDGR